MTDALNLALNRFDVPPVSAGLADRIMAAAATPTSAPFGAPRRDRRGLWRRGRQVLLGTLAVGLLSAGAVASGLLGSVGIEVPVLTAMLAPKPKPVAKPVHLTPKPAPVRSAIAAPPAALVEAAPVGLLPRPLLPVERMALREERRERRQVFAAEHPVAAAIIRERVREQLQRRALARRQALMTPGIDPSIPGGRSLDFADRAALAQAARRDRLVAEKMIDRRIQAREARMVGKQDRNISGLVGPPAARVEPEPAVGPDARARQQRPPINGFGLRQQQMTAEERAARRARILQMPPEERAQLRERMQQRRALRLERERQTPGLTQGQNPARAQNREGFPRVRR